MADIDKLVIKVESESQSAVSGIDALATSLGKLKSATSGGLGLNSVAKNLNSIKTSVDNMGNITNKLNGLSRAIESLGKLGNIKVSASIGNQITKIGDALSKLNIGDGGNKITELVTALRPLETLGKSSLGTTVNALNKLPEALNKIDTRTLYTQINSLTRIMKPLADEMQKVANGFNAFPSRIQKLIKSNDSLSQSNDKTSNSYINLWAKLNMAMNAVKTVSSYIASAIKNSTEYTETINRFNVSMGEYAKEAGNYAEKVSEVMGIDPAEWMSNQATFMVLAKGFGIVSDRAYTMSKNLTQLTYDLSSFHDISFENAMQKLQSGFAGELEPLRRIGYDLSQARLQQEAYILGIDKKIAKMTQAEKAELRYYAIMKQSTLAMGDMARTLSSPSNQLRIFQAQVKQAARAIGNIFIPILNLVLPYLIAFAKVVRLVADAIASIFGFELPEVSNIDIGDFAGDVGDISNNMGDTSDKAKDTSDALKDATDNAKKLKSYLLGFDELNVINPPDDSSDKSDKSDILDDLTGSGGDGIGGSGFDFALPEYDFLDGAIDSKVKEIMEKLEPVLTFIKNHMDDILQTVVAIGAGIIGWKLTDFAQSLIQFIKDKKLDKVKLGISLMVTGVTLGLMNGYEIGKNGLTTIDFLQQLLATALMVGGSLLTFGTGPLGWTVGIGLALVVNIASISLGRHHAKLEEDLDKRFGEYELSDTELSNWVQKLTTSDMSLKIGLYVNEQESLESLKIQVESSIEKVNGYNFRILCGLEVSQADYTAAVDELIESTQTYLEQKQVTTLLAVDILLGDSDTGTRLSGFANEFYSANQNTLKELGEKLRGVISTGFVDGEWIPEKLQEAIELQKEIQEILDYVSDVEFQAKITSLKLDATKTDITAESFQTLLDKANDEIENQIKNLEGVRLEGLKVAKMEFDQNILKGMSETEATTIYNQTVTEIEQRFNEGKVNLTYGTFEFGTDVILDKYADEVKKTVPLLQQSTEDMFVQGSMCVLPEDTYTNIDALMMQLGDAYMGGFMSLDISSEARKNIGKLLKQLEPSEAQLKDMVDNAVKTGAKVPENVSKGLRDVNLLKAIEGDVEAMHYLIGDKLSTDTSFLDLLATSEDAGKSINTNVSAGLKGSLQVVEDSANGTIILMNDTIGEKVLEVTPTLVKNLTDLGYNLSDGLLKGAEEEINKDKPKWTEWAWLPWNWFKESNEINSPSKLFERGGSYLALGLFGGVDENTKESDYKGVFGRLGTWFNSVFGTENGSKSSVFKTLGSLISDGLFGGIDGGVDAKKYTEVFSKITSAMESVKGNLVDVINTILTYIEKMANGVINGINGMIKKLNVLKIDVPDWVKEKMGISSFGFNIPLLTAITVPRIELKGDGGFVDRGQLFIAREAGAEMVGSIGRRTAVANNDQIVAGIASGVAEANNESNSLLREQNSLLRAMLEKESGVYLDGKTITKSVEKHQRERGRVLVTGGAY